MTQPRTSRYSSSTNSPARVRMDGKTSASAEPLPGTPKPSSGYERYKQQLHAFFNGDKPLPDHLRDMLATRPGASDHGFEGGDEAAVIDEAPAKPKRKKKSAQTAPVASDADGGRRRVVAAAGDDLILVEAIRKASSPREVEASVDALLARGASLPKDSEVLGKALSHSNDDVLEQALQGLCAIVAEEGGFRGNATLLKTRLKNVSLLSSSPTVRELCAVLTAKLA